MITIIDGTDLDDPVLNGTDGTDIIRGFAGDDVIRGLGDVDTIHGDEGKDEIFGGDGDDNLFGDEGADEIFGGDGNDRLVDDDVETRPYGNDRLFGETGHDTLVSYGGVDILDGGPGNDTYALRGGQVTIIDFGGRDEIDASRTEEKAFIDLSVAAVSSVAGQLITFAPGVEIENAKGGGNDDTIIGSDFGNIIMGADGSDMITGGGSQDQLHGDAGDDMFFYSGYTNGYDFISGGEGVDIVKAIANDTIIGLSGLEGIETITSSDFINVRVRGSAEGDELDFSTVAMPGIRTIEGADGNDIIIGSASNDSIKGGNGQDILNGGEEADFLYGGADADTFLFGETAFDAVDILRDFSLSDGDKIELSDILIGFDPLTSDITHFVRITANTVNSLMAVDRDGAGGTETFINIARIDANNALSDEQALLDSGVLIIS